MNNDDLYTIPLTEERKKPTTGFFMMLLSLPNEDNWETFPCNVKNSQNVSWLLTSNELRQNDEFTNALENLIASIYKKSYVFKYFNVELNTENNTIFFQNLSKKSIFKSNRFTVYLKIPDKSKTFFKPSLWWNTRYGSEWPEWVLAQDLSNITNGTLSNNNIPGNDPHAFIPPFEISFRAQGIEPNYLRFNRFDSPNLEDNILTMLSYDSATNTLIPFFEPELILPYTEGLSLTQDLEFKVLDSARNQVLISDFSQLFIVINLL